MFNSFVGLFKHDTVIDQNDLRRNNTHMEGSSKTEKLPALTEIMEIP